MQVIQSLLLFVLAGLAEMGGGYLVWLWLRGGRGLLLGRWPPCGDGGSMGSGPTAST